MRYRAIISLLLCVFLTGCQTTVRVDSQRPEATPTPHPPAAPADYFPRQDWRHTFEVIEAFGQNKTDVTEELLVSPDRVIGIYNGSPYVSWFVRPDGVWRLDPKGDVLLRYLPIPPPDGPVAWKQQSGDSEVWFHMEPTSCPIGKVTRCWDLTVLNRGEVTRYEWATSLGPIRAKAENLLNPSLSFTKQFRDSPFGEPATLDPSKRAAWLAASAPPAQPKWAPIATVTADQFAAARKAAAEAPFRDALKQWADMIARNDYAAMASQLRPDALHLSTYDDPPTEAKPRYISGPAAAAAVEALFQGARPKLEAYDLNQYAVLLLVSGVNPATLKGGYGETLTYGGLTLITIRRNDQGRFHLDGLYADSGRHLEKSWQTDPRWQTP